MKKFLLLILCSSISFILPVTANAQNFFLWRTLYPTTRIVKRAKIYQDSTGQKTIVLVPMAHIGKKKGFKQVAAFLDKLKADGYVTFWEGVALTDVDMDTDTDITYPEFIKHPEYHKSIDDPDISALYQKFLKIAPEDFSAEINYNPTKRNTLQTTKVLGTTTNKDIWVDYTLKQIIENYESEYGEINSNTKYNWAKFDIAVTDYRTKHLVNRIISSYHNKIAVVYGAGHKLELKLQLRYDHGYTKLDKKLLKKYR